MSTSISPASSATTVVLNLRNVVAAIRRDPSRVSSQFAAMSWKEIAVMIYRLARSQRPGHSPATVETPPFADEWLDAYDAGRDVVRWYANEFAG